MCNTNSMCIDVIHETVREPSVKCAYEIKKNDYNSILCSFLDQWVSAKYCLICSHNRTEKEGKP